MKKILMLVGLSLLLISIFGCSKTTPITVTQEEVEQYQDDKAKLEDAVLSKDINNCDGLDSRDKARCIKDIAVNKSDETLCKEIGKDDGKNWGMDQECYLQIAIQKNQVSLCDSLANGAQKNGCIFTIAENINNIELCKQIDNTIASGKADIYLCYTGLARINEDASICNNIDKQVNKDWCLIEVAASSDDLEICNLIEDSFRKDTCKGKVGTD